MASNMKIWNYQNHFQGQIFGKKNLKKFGCIIIEYFRLYIKLIIFHLNVMFTKMYVKIHFWESFAFSGVIFKFYSSKIFYNLLSEIFLKNIPLH